MSKLICKVLTLIWISLILSGCATHKLGSRVIPTEGPSISELYHEGGQSQDLSKSVKYRPYETILNPDDFVALGENSLSNQFNLVHNPALYVYVYPHLSTSEQIPVPGYYTKFRLYPHDHWALPGEKTMEQKS